MLIVLQDFGYEEETKHNEQHSPIKHRTATNLRFDICLFMNVEKKNTKKINVQYVLSVIVLFCCFLFSYCIETKPLVCVLCVRVKTFS